MGLCSHTRKIMQENKLFIGVIGTGAISDIYLKNMSQKFGNLELEAIASRHFENAVKKAKEYGLKAQTTEELIHNPKVDLIVVLTPVGSHYELIKAALLAGKHVYTEKTITEDLVKAKELIDLANEKGLYLGSAPDTFMGAAYQTAQRAIDSGLIGEVNSFAISANRDNNILLSLYPYLRESGAGVLFDYAVYYITALISLLGPVERVGGITEMPYKTFTNIIPGMPDYGKVMDNPNESRVSAILKMKNGISGTLHIDGNNIITDQAYFSIYGTKGILYMSDPNTFGGEVKFLPYSMDPRIKTDPINLWNFSDYIEDSRGMGIADAANAVLNCKKCRASKELAFHVLEVLESINQGGDKGAFIDIKSFCDKPEPMPLASVPITNIGHASFVAKNMEEMLHFYEDILGMKRLFTLTMNELTDWVEKKYDLSKAEVSELRSRGDLPWIEYLKLADHQYIELFHNIEGEKEPFIDRQDYYGYLKLNYEVDDIEAIKKVLVDAGVEMKQDIRKVVDGALELVVHDPDGNEVQFTQYDKNGLLPLTEKKEHNVCSQVKFTTQVAYNVKDAVNMKNFYCMGLGLRCVKTLTYGDLALYLEEMGAEEELISNLKMIRDEPWIDYIEVAPHQFIELFYTVGATKKERRDLSGYYNYQHLCLEVSDIYEAKEAIMKNGIKLDKDIDLGPDGAYQLWIVDPDGNRIEFMQYTKNSKQLIEK